MTPTDIRLESRKRILNRFDPLYLFLDLVVFDRLFRPPKRNVRGEFEELATADVDFLAENLSKHRIVLWLNALLILYLCPHGIKTILQHGDPGIVVTGLLAPAMITGGAWYAVSFGGIPEKFINVALVLTSLMFLSFTFSMTLLITLLCRLTPWPVGAFILVPIYVTLYLASVLYDNLDGLKIGLDTALLKFSRATLNYYQKHGFVTRRETEADVFEEGAAAQSNEIALFTHFLNMLERNLQQLDRGQMLPVANHLIASSIDIFFNIVDLSLPPTAKFDRGTEFPSYIKDASQMTQADVDSLTIRYLGLIIEAFSTIPGLEQSGQLSAAKATLKEFTALRGSVVNQTLADHLFSHVFQQLFSLMSTHRLILFQGRRGSSLIV